MRLGSISLADAPRHVCLDGNPVGRDYPDMSELDDLARATQSRKLPQPLPYQAPIAERPLSFRDKFNTGFSYGLGFWTAGFVFSIVIFIATLVLGWLSCSQTPNSRQGIRSQYDGVTWETHQTKDGYYEECTEMHVRAMYDDKGRIMIICTHNCDNGDGWEREGENDFFFHEFSEKRAFPLGINIVFYLMTH